MSNEASAEELRRQYDRALDEYRFQVDLNWRRSEYFFVLNVGVLIAAGTMFSSDAVPRALVAVLFLIGALLAVLSVLANEAQHTYYRSARELKKSLEKQLDLKDLALATTPGMGSRFGRLGRVRTFLKIMLIAIALVDIGGVAFAIDAATGSEASSDRVVSVQIKPAGRKEPAALVVSRGDEIVQYRELDPGSAFLLLKLESGSYLFSVGGRSICRKHVDVVDHPLQPVVLHC